MEEVGKKKGSCRGGGVKEEVTLITGPFLQPDTAVFPQRRTLACPLEWKGNVNIQESIFGRMWGVSLEVVGEGRGVGWGRGLQQQGIRGRMWAERKELCGSRMLLRVSPIRGTSVVLCALAGKTVHLCSTLFLCPISRGSERRCPVYSHGVVGCACLGFRGWIFPFSPKGPAKRICKDSTTQYLDARTLSRLPQTVCKPHTFKANAPRKIALYVVPASQNVRICSFSPFLYLRISLGFGDLVGQNISR